MAHIIIKIEPHFLPPFQAEYDGKYISLKGRDKNFPFTTYGLNASDSDEILGYDEKILIPIVLEIRNANPYVLNWGRKSIWVEY